MFAASKSGAVAAAPADQQFDYVTLLLNGDGTNGAQNNTFLDSSTNNFSITRNGNTTQGSFSPYGSLWSNYFNGSSYLKTNGSSNPSLGTGDFTVECWFYMNARGVIVSPIAQLPSTTDGVWRLSVCNGSSNDAIQVVVRSGGNWVTVIDQTTTWNVGTWNHVAISRQSGTLRAFANGALISSASSSQSFGSSTFPIYLGYLDNSGNDNIFFNGYVSNARITNTAVYTSAFTPSITPLTAISGTVFLSAQSNRFVDNSSNAYTFTISGSPSVQRFSPFNPTVPYSTATIGGSGYFTGSNASDYLSTSALGSQSLLSVGAWIYPISYNGGKMSIANQNYSAWNFNVNNDGSLEVRNNAGGGVQVSSSSGVVQFNAWNYVMFTYNTSTGSWNLYCNGINVGSNTAYQSIGVNSALYFGKRWSIGASYGDYFNGYMSDVIVSTNIRSSTVPTSPVASDGSTFVLCNMTNAGIPDYAMMNDLETVGNAQVSTSVKKYGTGSLYFNGSSSYLYFPNLPQYQFGTGDFTVEFWYYPTTSGSLTVMGKRATGASQTDWVIFQNSTTLNFYCSSNGSSWSLWSGATIGTVSLNTWNHVAVYRTGNNWYGAVSGTVSSFGSNSSSIYNGSAPIVIGGDTDGYYITGYIDDARITKGYCRYGSSNFTPPTTALPTY